MSLRMANPGALGICAALLLSTAAHGQDTPTHKPILKARVEPKEFGVQDQTYRVYHATEFAGDKFVGSIYTDNLGRTPISPDYDTHYYTTLDLPAGAVIDAIGLNSSTDINGIIGFELWQRNRDGSKVSLVAFSVPAHSWRTDFAELLNIPIADHVDKEYVMDVENASSPDDQFFGWVEVHWHRTVSPAPATATFADVPPSHPFFQFIEAITEAGITAGCGGGNFCPDQAITRKQEAAFISKALGLHWPN